jgi:non-ribosomal peptide synthetase component F
VGSPCLTLDLVYQGRLFCPETVAGIAGHVRTLIENFVAHPEHRLANLNMLAAHEHHALTAPRMPAAPIEPHLFAHQLFERAADRCPTAVAIEHPGGSISFSQLNERSNRLANYLREQGAQPDDLVGICLDRSPDAVTAVLAVLKAGAAFVLLPPDLPGPRLAAVLQDARPKLLITTAPHAAKLQGYTSTVLCLDRLESVIARHSGANLASVARPGQAAYAAFTSGSTGRPKAAIVTHRALANHTQAVSRAYACGPTGRRLQFASLGSDMFVSEVFTYLCSGTTLVFCAAGGGNSMAEFLQLIELHRITIAGMPASWWSVWAAAVACGDLRIPVSLRVLIVGMERLNADALAEFRRVADTRLKIFNAYGPSETGPIATLYEAGTSAWESASLVPIGGPIANNRVYVLDEYGNPVPYGVPG